MPLKLLILLEFSPRDGLKNGLKKAKIRAYLNANVHPSSLPEERTINSSRAAPKSSRLWAKFVKLDATEVNERAA